jgi:hypothetical protein
MARQIDTIANRITLEGGAEILKFLDSMGKEGQAAATKLRDAFQKSGFDKGVTQKVGIIRKSLLGLGVDARKVAGDFNPLRTTLLGLQSLVGGLFRGAGVGAGFGAAGLGAALAALTVAAGRNAAALKDQASQFGVSTDALQKYGNVAKEATGSVDALGGFLTTFSDRIDENTKKLRESTSSFEVYSEGADSAATKTVKVIQGVQGLNAEGDKLQKNLDFKVPGEGLDKMAETTVKVVRGAQNINEELAKQSDLFRGITQEQFKSGEAFDIVAKRLESVTNRVQALRDAGVPKSQAGPLSDFLAQLSENAKKAGDEATKAGAALKDGFVDILSPEEIKTLSDMNSEINKLTGNLSTLFSRSAAGQADDIGGALGFINRKLEEMDARAQKATGSVSGAAGVLRVLFGSGGNQGPAGRGTEPPVISNLNDLAEAVQQVATSAQEVQPPSPEAFDEFAELARLSAENAALALSQTGQNVIVDVPDTAFDEFDMQARNAAERAASELPGPFESAWSTIESEASDALGQVARLINDIISSVAAAIKRVENLKSSASRGGGSSGGGFGGGGGSGFAWGGLIRGPGGPRGDKIPIMASDREYMMQAAATDYYGTRIMSLLNKRLIPRSVFERLAGAGYRDGGLVRSLRDPFSVPRFADGGLVTVPAAAPSSGQAVILQLPGGQQIPGFQATESALDQLARATTRGKLLTTRSGRL